jgi:hypothetical protein
VRRGVARRWLLACALLYLPQLLPFAVGPLRECDHCVVTYLQLFLVLPGFLAGGLAAGGTTWVAVTLMGLVTVGVIVLLCATTGSGPEREAGSLGRVLIVVAPLLSAANSLAIASALRA